MISLTDFFDAALRCHNDVILLPAIHIVSSNDFVPAKQCTSTPCVHTAASTNAKTFLRQTCGLQTDYETWTVVQHRVYHRKIHSVGKLKRRLIDVWCGLKQSTFDKAINQWQGRHLACVPAKGKHLEYSL